jgi:hypothetical protein
MRCHFAFATFALTMLFVSGAARGEVQQAGGWHAPTDNGDRYGGGSSAPSPSAAPSDAAARPSGNYGASNAATGPIAAAAPAPAGPVPTHARVSKGAGTLPNDQGQVWREYDITPYTSRIASTNRPEQLIVDWILRETGYEAWHSDPVGLLSANHDTLRVYHTPQMQAVVADIVDRFVNTQADNYAFSLRIATVTNPNWRAKALPMMTPIPVQTPGVQGWLLAKEDARLLVADMSRRTDYREFNSPQQLILNGQSVVISTMQPRQYVKGAVPTQTAWPGFQPEMGQIEEGFSLEFSPLLALDSQSADTVIKLRLSQIEKLVPVKLDLPSTTGATQRVGIDVPQITMANMHERFHWPIDKVLLLSMGVVATPAPTKDNPITDMMGDAVPMLKSPPRADALLFVESRGQVTPSATPVGGAGEHAATLPEQTFHGRY